MAERTFDYSSVAEVYQKMLNITEEISDLLEQTDTSYHDAVNVSEEAIYGDLGQQLLLDWDNTASSFPNFVSNFENWSAVISASGGDYSKFEEAIKGFQAEHTFGSASDTSMTDAYTNTGYYANYTAENYDSLVESLDSLKSLNNVDLSAVAYEYSDSQALLTKHKVVSSIMLAGDIVSVALIAVGAIGTVTGAGSSSTSLVPTGGSGGSAALNTPLLGEGESMSIDSFVECVKAQGSARQIAAAEQLANNGVTTVVRNATGDVVQFLDSSGQVVGYVSANATNTATQVANTAATVVESTSTTGSGSASILSRAAETIKNAVSSAASKVKGAVNAAKNVASSAASKIGSAISSAKGSVSAAATAAKNVAGKVSSAAGSTLKNAVGAISSTASSHPVATAVVAGTVVNQTIDNLKN